MFLYVHSIITQRRVQFSSLQSQTQHLLTAAAQALVTLSLFLCLFLWLQHRLKAMDDKLLVKSHDSHMIEGLDHMTQGHNHVTSLKELSPVNGIPKSLHINGSELADGEMLTQQSWDTPPDVSHLPAEVCSSLSF